MDKKEVQNAIGTGVVLLDVFLAVHGIPPVASITERIVGLVTSTREAIFAEKIDAFFGEPTAIDPKVKETFLASLEENREEFMKRIWIAVDRLNDRETSALLGKVFKSTVEGKVTVQDFLKISHMVSLVYISDLKYLINVHNVTKPGVFEGAHDPDIDLQLAAIGLMIQTALPVFGTATNHATYRPSKWGRIIAEHGVMKK